MTVSITPLKQNKKTQQNTLYTRSDTACVANLNHDLFHFKQGCTYVEYSFCFIHCFFFFNLKVIIHRHSYCDLTRRNNKVVVAFKSLWQLCHMQVMIYVK